MKLLYPAIFTPCLEKEGFTVVVPDLPGCVSEGDSLLHALEMATDAACGWVLGELEDGNSIPAATPMENIHPEEGSFANLLMLDMDTYTELYGEKAVRKNITIPAWLNTYGERNNINFSRVLQDALLLRAQSL